MNAAANKAKIEAYFAKLRDKITERVPVIVQETAIEYFKESFTTKQFDGVAWAPVKKEVKRGSLMVRSGKLVNSIGVSPDSTNDRIIIRAGSYKVPYARIHNEGLTVNTTAHVRSFTRNNYKTSKRGKRSVKSTSIVKEHTRRMNYTMPKRQFIGHSAELNTRIINRIKGLLKSKG